MYTGPSSWKIDLDKPIEMVWTDVETTGLDSKHEVLLEVGVILTDRYGNEAGHFQSLVFDSYMRQRLANAAEVVIGMHTRNGLIKELDAVADQHANDENSTTWNSYSPSSVDHHLRNFLNNVGKASLFPMCGSTVNFDRDFYREYLPSSIEWFHYRNLDITSLKNACKLLNPDLLARLPATPNHRHRPLDDLRNTIAEWKFYQDEFLIWDGPIPE